MNQHIRKQIGMSPELYRNLKLYTYLWSSKTGYMTFDELREKSGIEQVWLTYIINKNLEAKKIIKKKVDDPKKPGERITAYSIAPDGENDLYSFMFWFSPDGKNDVSLFKKWFDSYFTDWSTTIFHKGRSRGHSTIE